jgi:hypothetical protein
MPLLEVSKGSFFPYRPTSPSGKRSKSIPHYLTSIRLTPHSKHNEEAKLYNKRIPASYHLRALHHPKTNEPIDYFPQTPDDIKTMSGE